MAVISRTTASIPAGEQTDTEAHVDVDSVGTGTHVLYGHTSDLGSSPATWEASATELATVEAGDTVAWTERTPNTAYYFAVVTTDGGTTLSNVLTITTAYARPTNLTIVTRTTTTARVTWDDASGGSASHILLFAESPAALSDLAVAGIIPAGADIDYTFSDLDSTQSYIFAAVASDGSDRVSGIEEVSAPSDPAVAVPALPISDDSFLPWRPKFVYGSGGDADTWEATLPCRYWTEIATSVGGTAVASSGYAQGYVVRSDVLLELPVRFYEPDWQNLWQLIRWGQSERSFLYYPDANNTASFTVYLHQPAVGEALTVQIMEDYPLGREITLTLRMANSTLPFGLEFDP